jgi:catechol 2,3-dioxygenase-like lactoylglutathione lyase family enzyme
MGHIGVTVPDVDAAAAWYGETFGWRLIAGPFDVDTSDPGVAAQLREVFATEEVAFRQAHLEAGPGLALELFEFRRPPTVAAAGFEFRRVGPFHICVVEPEIEALVERIEAGGGRRRTQIREIFPGEPYRFCYCEDPFGLAIEVATHSHAESFEGRAGYETPTHGQES